MKFFLCFFFKIKGWSCLSGLVHKANFVMLHVLLDIDPPPPPMLHSVHTWMTPPPPPLMRTSSQELVTLPPPLPSFPLFSSLPFSFKDRVFRFYGTLREIGISGELSVHFWNAVYQSEGNQLLYGMKEKISYENSNYGKYLVF